ncbi:winged helix-turn-helix transcriptional regulator [Oricola thermophila]|uniref:Helix-turn-helix transcriptional regulator n=1 Tax=Oricola thermophila TaxID=2742145 RepID=A0A6N1V907_9HYPH|nr:helix-turn-helix domain-containing protein [Oricola thermophila]QKV17481.1 helix-turn-helix transcriptional regulator [Oricola thermophila]
MDTVREAETAVASRFDRYDCNGGCPVEAALEQIAGKWKGMIIFHLMDGTLRFNELARRVGGVTQRSLTKQLRELEADGIVHRKVYAVVPPRVEYSLTEKGERLRDVIEALRDWGSQYRKAGQGAAASPGHCS